MLPGFVCFRGREAPGPDEERHVPAPDDLQLHEHYGPEARYAVAAEAAMPTTKWDEEVARGLELGLPGADSIVDKRIPTFSRGELPHYAGINTFLKQPYVEDVRRCGEYDIAILGAPHDSGTTYRPGTRFGPQGMRRISALYGPYSFELGVDVPVEVDDAEIARQVLGHPAHGR
ncbi:MAG: agmatinase, partial [Actinomycetota bacterium]|nr:agmatinase [Actinomycetota bacterium]